MDCLMTSEPWILVLAGLGVVLLAGIVVAAVGTAIEYYRPLPKRVVLDTTRAQANMLSAIRDSGLSEYYRRYRHDSEV